MYQALYRKYRPQTFNEVVGQDVIIRTLKNEIEKQKISHAYLFTGPRGTGKTSVAKLLAKVVNCENPENFTPCGKCVSCTQIQNSDIIEIDAASNNGVDEIREIRNKVNLVPSVSKYKVYIIDEVHMLTTGAFNALLKTLEEPPAHVIFILATTDPHKIPTTILSRCQRFDFKKVQTNTIVERLKHIVAQEELNIGEKALQEIAFLCDGGMRDAISILDQAIAYSDNEITENDIHEIVGTVGNEDINEFFKSLLHGNLSNSLEFINKCNDSGKNLIKVAEKMMYFLKDNLIESVQNGSKVYELSKEELIDLIKDFNETISTMKKSSDPKLLFDLFVIKNSNLSTTDSQIVKKEIIVEKTVIVEKQEPTTVSQAVIEENIPKVEKNVEKTTKKPVTKNFPGNNDDKLNKLIEIRINNALAGFNKKDLLELKKASYKINDLLLDPDYSEMASLILDGDIKALGNNYIIFVYKTPSIQDIFNHRILKIEEALSKAFGNDYLVVSTNQDDWEIIKKQFNSKEKVFTFIEETQDLLDCLLELDENINDDIDSMFGSIVEYN